jgi:hypothetical protein
MHATLSPPSPPAYALALQFLIDAVDAAVPPPPPGAVSTGTSVSEALSRHRAPSPAAIVNATLALQALFLLTQVRLREAEAGVTLELRADSDGATPCFSLYPPPHPFRTNCPMQTHGLEYPRFYAAVYSLLNPATLAAKHRARFVALLDLVLSSPILPAYLVSCAASRY